ncbi:MAG: flagellar basal body P-ring formation protein FlgA [Candidatus Latescibacteria bacterium]|nr:flagellar basal body P-ring formation protein FlgA [Candidatus Latescibacterota bacterium]
MVVILAILSVITVPGPALLLGEIADAFSFSRVSVTLRDSVTVPGPALLLGEIATVADGDTVTVARFSRVVVAPAPPLGQSRRLTRVYIDRAIRGAGIAPTSFDLIGAESVVVVTSAALLPADEIRTKVVGELVGRWAGDPADLTIEFPSLIPNVTIPGRPVTVQITWSGMAFPRGNVLTYIDILEGTELLQRVPVAVRVRTFGPVVIAARRIRQFQLLVAGDLTVDRRETTSLSDETFSSPDSLLGLRARGNIELSQVVEHRMVEFPPLIHRGDLVTILIRQGRVSASTRGEAREDGRIGDRIRVRNVASNRDLVARVVDARTVVIEP